MLILLALVIGALSYYWFKYHYCYKSLLQLPTLSKNNYFMGCISYFGNSISENFHALVGIPQKFGPIVRVYLGPFRRSVIVTGPKDVEFFLSSSEHINKSPGYDGYKPWLGDGLINSAGDHWRKHRRIITPTFHFQILDQFAYYINSNSKYLVKKLKLVAGKDYDIYPLISLYALDVICESAMKIKINAMDNEHLEYIEAVKTYLDIYIFRFFSFILQNDFLFKFTREYRTQQHAIKTLKTFTESVITQRRAERRLTKKIKGENKDTELIKEDDVGLKKRIAFLDLLLDMADEGQDLTDSEIREEVDTFMFAGHDTVSCSICFALFELAKHPEVQQRIFQESIEVLGEVDTEELTFRNVQDMKYLDMVIKETMRIYSPVPFIERQLTREVTNNGVTYPSETIITLVPFAMHRNPEIFPDPLKFDPNRFLPENVAKRHPFAYIPFSAGPRNCIGQRFATLQTKATVIKIIRTFKISPVSPAHELDLANDAVLKSFNGLPIILNLR